MTKAVKSPFSGKNTTLGLAWSYQKMFKEAIQANYQENRKLKCFILLPVGEIKKVHLVFLIIMKYEPRDNSMPHHHVHATVETERAPSQLRVLAYINHIPVCIDMFSPCWDGARSVSTVGDSLLLLVLLFKKSLQQPSKNRPYFRKVSPRSQIRDSGARLQYADTQTITVIGQNIKLYLCCT